ncbi:MAG: hypothetical protein M5T52_11910 [Ignavibacteriaceae bacterium]|nr:hypothetical protein [Ignavibacteriaceae bacterium]
MHSFSYTSGTQERCAQSEIMEAIWVAAEMRAGAAYAHANIAMDEMEKHNQKINRSV